MREYLFIVFLGILMAFVRAGAQTPCVATIINGGTTTIAFKLGPNNWSLGQGAGSTYEIPCSGGIITVFTYANGGTLANQVTYTVNAGKRYQIYWNLAVKRWDLKVI